MKTIAKITLLILITTQSVNANRTCDDYITDEWPDSRYIIQNLSGDNVVTDNKTGLMWKRCAQGLTGIDCMTGSLTTHTWQQALDSASIENFGGFADWRVPNVEELRSIAAINCYNPAINEIAFPNTPLYWFWSSSPFVIAPYLSWNISFYTGGSDSNCYHQCNNEPLHQLKTEPV